MEPGKRVASGAVTYAAAAILQRAVPFLLLPLFTRILSPAEFGQVGILTTVASAVTVLVGLGLESAVFRGYLKVADGSGDPRTFVSTVGGFVVVAAITVSALLALLAAPVLAQFLNVPIPALRFATIGAALMSVSAVVPLALLRARERLGDYLQLTGFQVLVTPGLMILFVAVMGLGATGWMLAYMLGSAVLLVRGLLMIRHDWAPEFDFGHLRSALVFGLPLLPHAIAHWGLSVSDRAILGIYVPSAQIGAYYAAFVISLPITLAAASLSQATQPTYVDASTSLEHRRTLSGIITAHAVFVIFIGALVMLLGPPIQHVILPDAYGEAADFIPWLAVGATLFGLYLVPMNLITMTVGLTRRVWIITVVAAAANVWLNLLFVPQFGATAAAVNTTIGYGLLLVGISLYAWRVCHPRVTIQLGRISAGLIMIAIPVIATAILTPADTVAGLAVRIVVLVAVAAALIAIGPFRATAREFAQAWR